MRFCLIVAVIFISAAPPAWGQTKIWSESPKTQVWSETPRTGNWSDNLTLPSPGATPAPPAPAVSGTGAGQWAAPVYTKRRSDEDIQRQVDGIAKDAERKARAGGGASVRGQGGQTDVPGQVWRDHVDRTRAQDQFRRDEDAHYERQRSYNPR